MHVLVIPSWYPTADRPLQGAYIEEQVQAMRGRGLRCGVLYPEHRSLRRLSPARLRSFHFQRRLRVENGVAVVRSHGWNAWSRTPLRFSWILRETDRLGVVYEHFAGRPDVILAHSAQWAAAAARRLSSRWGKPYLVIEHFSGFALADLHSYERAIGRWGLQGASKCLAVSSFLCRRLITNGYIPPAGVEVLPNGIDTRLFHLQASRNTRSRFRWITITSPRRSKGTALLIKAFTMLRGRADVELHIIGGTERGLVERASRRWAVGEHIQFTGRLPRREAREALRNADAYVCPSYVETFGIPLIEAMATGIPVVSTNCGGPADIVTPSTGILTPVDDPKALAAAMHSLQGSYSDYDKEALHQYIASHFSLRTITDRLIDHMRSIT